MDKLHTAISLREAGKLEEARTLLIELVTEEPQNSSMWYQLAYLFYSDKLDQVWD